MFQIYGNSANNTTENIISRLLVEAYLPCVEEFLYFQIGTDKVLDDIEQMIKTGSVLEELKKEGINNFYFKKNIHNFKLKEGILTASSISVWKSSTQDTCILDIVLLSTTQELLDDPYEESSDNLGLIVKGSIWLRHKEGYLFNSNLIRELTNKITEYAIDCSEYTSSKIKQEQLNGSYSFSRVSLTPNSTGGVKLNITEEFGHTSNIDISIDPNVWHNVNMEKLEKRLLDADTSYKGIKDYLLIIAGVPGTGKTQLAKYLVTNCKIDKNKKVFVINPNDVNNKELLTSLINNILEEDKLTESYNSYYIIVNDMKMEYLTNCNSLKEEDKVFYNTLLNLNDYCFKKIKVILTTNDEVDEKEFTVNPLFRRGRLLGYLKLEPFTPSLIIKDIDKGGYSKLYDNDFTRKLKEKLQSLGDVSITAAQYNDIITELNHQMDASYTENYTNFYK